MVVEVHEAATWVVLHDLEALHQEAFLVVVLPYLDQSLVVEGVSSPAAKAWVVPRMEEAHVMVVGLPSQVVAVDLVEGDQEISRQGEVGHQVVWDL